MNKIGRISLYVIFGGIFLSSLSAYAKEIEVPTFSKNNSFSLTKSLAKIADEKDDVQTKASMLPSNF